MTAPECPRDGRPIHDSAYVCGSCGSDLAQALGDVPALSDELDLTLSRQTAQGQRVGGRSADKPLPFDYGASEATFALKSTLVSWVRELAEEGDMWPADNLPAIGRWLLASVEDFRRREDAQEAVDEISDAVAQCRRVIDRRAEKIYAGQCKADLEDGTSCEELLFGRPGRDGVTCVCGAWYSVRERRDTMLAEIHDMLFTAAEIAGLAAYLDVFAERQRVRMLLNAWGKRGVLVAHGLTVNGVPRYKFSEAIDLVADRSKVA